MFNPITASENIKDEFISYITTQFNISDPTYASKFIDELGKKGNVTKGPYLEINDAFEKGKNLSSLIDQGTVSPLFRELEGDLPDGEKELQLNRSLYQHQEQSIIKTNQGKNLVITTGTGSGKTECFVIPIIDHLLREIEKGTLSSGVRAIVIYPMNALANDQMKRLRVLLGHYPKITFGVYNSSTEETEEKGIAEYERAFRTAANQKPKPLPNEIISRERMRSTPPHILITNYAMLEYMMLRPKDDLVFSGAKLRFLVLDEAHIYRGATGMETSLLLMRLKARISNPNKVLHILTSATLGGKKADNAIVQFAQTLCHAEFHKTDIIRSKCIAPEFDDNPIEVPLQLFAEMANPSRPLNDIVADYGLSIPDGQSDEEFIYELCNRTTVYQALRNAIRSAMTIDEITQRLQIDFSITDQDIINIIQVAVQGVKNGTALLKARYHFFAKAPEGMYLTLDDSKELTLTRQKYINITGKARKVFEVAICDDCGRIAIIGTEKRGKIEFTSNQFDKNFRYFQLLGNDHDVIIEDDEEDDEGNSLPSEIGKDDYQICTSCGTIIHTSQTGSQPCDCGKNTFIKVREIVPSESTHRTKCAICKQGTLRTYYLGAEAATSVLGTSLFEELPAKEAKLKSVKKDQSSSGGLFGVIPKARIAESVTRSKQFLTFSDSRGEAAFFATYMEGIYHEFLRRRGIWHVVETYREDMAQRPWEIETFVEKLTGYFDKNRTFANPGHTGAENLTPTSMKQAWIAVLNEMVNARRATSLVSLGMIKFNFKGNTPEIIQNVAEGLSQKPSDMQALFDLLVMDIVYHGAVEGDCNLTDNDRDYIFFNTRPKRVVKVKNGINDKKTPYLLSWLSRVRSTGSWLRNKRMTRVMKILEKTESEADNLLREYWDSILRENLSPTSDEMNSFFIKTDKFTIQAGSDKIPVFRCETCGKITMMNCKGLCANVSCGGTLKQISHESIIERNHYARLYQSQEMKPLHIKEHTAQLGRDEQLKYQEQFVNKEINALSCSTTFEMGVDVGDLETVFLRNMPPSPSNYVQRAGRAGRSLKSAAYSVTYAKLSSHDYTFYKDPIKMISGKIGVPIFAVQNEKIIRRHIYAIALSAFFSKYPEIYNSNNADVFLNEQGWETFLEFLSEKPESLKKTLKSSIPEEKHESMGILDYSWTENLIGVDGVLRIAVEDFRNTVQFYQSEFDRLNHKGETQEAAEIEKKLWRFRRAKDDKRGRNELIEFLVRSNVLPKYGFPVDTVELFQSANSNDDKKLRMVRDLQLAVSEYAPDSQIVADGKLYTSRYIRKLPLTTGLDWETSYIAECPNQECKTWNHSKVEPAVEGLTCVSCGEVIGKRSWQVAIEPRKGFIAESNPKDAPLRKPEKAFRSDDFYIGDSQRHITNKVDYTLKNGNRFRMESSTNDSLMVVCDDTFYVCPSCGYAESVPHLGKNIPRRSITKSHSTPWDSKCEAKLSRNKLIHVFKTDVVRITFDHPQASNYEVMISTLYALLEGFSSALEIERNDIKGCLHKIFINGRMTYTLVLYDAVAGGAGHVRRLSMDDNGTNFLKVIKSALDLTSKCNCSPSCYNCLRNYYNQKIHDYLNRDYAADFLSNWNDSIILREQIQ